MRNLFLVVLFTAVHHLAVAQSEFGNLANQQSVREEIGVIGSGKMVNGYGFNNDYKGILGSPFLVDDWESGSLVLSNNISKIHTQVRLKFDAFKNEIWLLYKKDSSILYSKDIFAFTLLESNKEFRKFSTPDEGNVFCQIIYSDSTYTLLKQEKKDLQKSNYVNKGMYTTGDKYDRFIDAGKYFISTGDGKLKSFNLKASAFEDLAPRNKKKFIKEYMKVEKFGKTLTVTQAITVLKYLSGN